MLGWVRVTLVVASIGILLALLILLIQRCRFPTNNKDSPDTNVQRTQNLQTGITQLPHHNKRKTNYYVFRRGFSSKPLFSWAENPSLVTDAVENGWSRFAFTTSTSSPSVRSLLEISWEVSQGSADFMQKIRLNYGLKKTTTSAIKTALPLPGPALGNSLPFPQEAYFEITILACHEDDDGELVRKVEMGKAEGEKIKLIQEQESCNHGKTNLESVNDNGNGNRRLEELKHGGEVVALSVGLTGGGSLPLKPPGSYPGSIGFNSNGSVYLDGIKLVFESEKEEWGRRNKVIGCGYNPSQKMVFFTLDSELVHEIHCKSEEFGSPLYPTVAANTAIMVVVNFGQSVFKYAPANLQRTPNPCFIGPLSNSTTLGYEDSKELFSMGRIDSQWLNPSTPRNSNINGSNKKGVDFDEVSEGDLFEIVLDSSGRSPHSPL